MLTAKICLLLLLTALCTPPALLADTFGAGNNQFTIDFVTIGNPGNPVDTTGAPNPAGSVPYVYRMGKYEISREAIEKANAEGNLGITLHPMSGVTGGARPATPATGVSWNEAARFVNYLNTSQGYPAAYKFGKQPGDVGYDPNGDIILRKPTDPGYDANNLFRNSQAHYFLPSVNEWYKSAFYDPNANGGVGGYWNYATGSDSVPTPVASGTNPGTAVWLREFKQGPADITQAGGLSPYGTMAQSGNVWEWEETEYDLLNDGRSSVRGLRGGFWNYNGPDYLSASGRVRDASPSHGFDGFEGFRVASIPEPSTGLLGMLGMLGLMQRRRRSR
ncbi:MAG: SUMF1/EgtB/PvdO family nonheme iron enzyme [Pirellulales bacterium]